MGFSINPYALANTRQFADDLFTSPQQRQQAGLVLIRENGMLVFNDTSQRLPRTEEQFRRLVAAIYGVEGHPLSAEQVAEALLDPNLQASRVAFLDRGVARFPARVEPTPMQRPQEPTPAPTHPRTSPQVALRQPAAAQRRVHLLQPNTREVAASTRPHSPTIHSLPESVRTRFANLTASYHYTRHALVSQAHRLQREGDNVTAQRLIYLVEMLDQRAADFMRQGPASDAPDMTSNNGELSQLVYLGQCAVGQHPAQASKDSGFYPPESRDQDDPGPTRASPYIADRDLPTERNPLVFWVSPF